jgi:hypothetical protein
VNGRSMKEVEAKADQLSLSPIYRQTDRQTDR